MYVTMYFTVKISTVYKVQRIQFSHQPVLIDFFTLPLLFLLHFPPFPSFSFDHFLTILY